MFTFSGRCKIVFFVHFWRSLCDERRFRVVKLVRASMSSMKPLLDWIPDLRVVHLVRDPRPVALSRRDFHASARGQFAEETKNLSQRVIREASLYCRRVVDDVRWRLRLEQQYPGRLYSLSYEQLVEDPVGRATEVYKFIDQALPRSVLTAFDQLASGQLQKSKAERGAGVGGNWTTKSGKYRASRWLTDRISRYEFEQINKRCMEMFELFPEYRDLKPKSFRIITHVLRSP